MDKVDSTQKQVGSVGEVRILRKNPKNVRDLKITEMMNVFDGLDTTSNLWSGDYINGILKPAKRTKTVKARTAYLRTAGQLQKVYHTSHGNTEGEERKE